MENLPKSIVLAALLAVGVILVIGLLNMARGGSANTSQRLMRWRVGLQFIAIVIMMAAIYWTSH